MKEEKENDLKEKINIIPIEDIKNYDEYKHEEKIVPKDIITVVNTLNPRYKSLISLSAYVDELYAKKRIEEAEKVRFSIFKTYDVHGLKFCNFYVRGYLKTLLKNISKDVEEKKINANDRIVKFINHEAKTILFVHPHMKKEEIEQETQKFTNYLEKGMEYVAIHSLGASIKIATDMARRITAPPSLKYTIKIIQTEKEGKPPEFSKIWYRGDGIKTYSLIIENEKDV